MKKLIFISTLSILGISVLISSNFSGGLYNSLKSNKLFLWLAPVVIEHFPNEFLAINHNFINPSKSELSLVLSQNDKTFNDSIISIAHEKGILLDEDKSWRSAHIIRDNTKYPVKYKLHGSDVVPFLKDKFSYSIKLDKEIFGYSKLKLVNEVEADYKLIFLKLMPKHFGMITEDPGEIVSINNGKNVELYHLYEFFDDSYIQREYGFENPVLIKKKTFIHGISGWTHDSALDEISYNMDLTTISSDYYERLNKVYHSEYEYSLKEKQYLGKFFALLYFFGSPVQITGDNERWVITDNYVLPLFRNEGVILELLINEEDRDEFDDYLFHNPWGPKRFKSNAFSKYQKMILDDQIRNYRNEAFSNLIYEEGKILRTFDSIFKSNEEIFKNFGDNFFLTKTKHYSKYLALLRQNLNLIENYLATGKAIAMQKDNTLYITSDSFVKLQVLVNDKTYDFEPKKYKLIGDKISIQNSEFKLHLNERLKTLKIVNRFAQDTINLRKDLLVVN